MGSLGSCWGSCWGSWGSWGSLGSFRDFSFSSFSSFSFSFSSFSTYTLLHERGSSKLAALKSTVPWNIQKNPVICSIVVISKKVYQCSAVVCAIKCLVSCLCLMSDFGQTFRKGCPKCVCLKLPFLRLLILWSIKREVKKSCIFHWFCMALKDYFMQTLDSQKLSKALTPKYAFAQ